MSIQLLKKPWVIGLATAFVLVLIGVGYTANIKANERKKLEETCTTNKNTDDCQKACDAGSAAGCNNLGVFYEQGKGVKQDIAKAAQLYKKVCDGGEATACRNLGHLYRKGKGIDEDYAKVAHYWQKACDGGDKEGCVEYARLYHYGNGVKQDYAQAALLYKKACDMGDADSCELTTAEKITEEQKRIVVANTIIGCEITGKFDDCQKACDAGGAIGCYNIGVLYAKGEGGVNQDLTKAMSLFQKACDGGEAKGCSNKAILEEALSASSSSGGSSSGNCDAIHNVDLHNLCKGIARDSSNCDAIHNVDLHNLCIGARDSSNCDAIHNVDLLWLCRAIR